MNPQLQTAVIQFLANEFQVEADTINMDTSLIEDFNLNPQQITDLMQRMQESLGLILPEEKINQLQTISDIIDILTSESEPADKPV